MQEFVFVLGVARLALLAALPSAPSPLIAAGTIAIQHDAVGCAIADQLPQFEAVLTPPDQVSRARIYFRPNGGEYWYSVEMEGDGEVFLGVLPRPTKSLAAFEYYISVVDTSFDESRSEEYTSRVVDGPSACGDSKAATTVATAAVKLAAPAGAPPVPLGFGAIAGEAAAGGAAAAVSSAGGGIGTAAVVGGIAVAGGAVALAASGGSDSGDAASATGGGASTTPTPAPTPAPTPTPEPSPTPTPEPEQLDVSGSWTGTRAGTLTGPEGSCDLMDDASLSLQQQGTAFQGTLTLVLRSSTCSASNIGLSRDIAVDGSRDGSTILFAARRDATEGLTAVDFVGTVDGGRMSGTFMSMGAGGTTGSGSLSLER